MMSGQAYGNVQGSDTLKKPIREVLNMMKIWGMCVWSKEATDVDRLIAEDLCGLFHVKAPVPMAKDDKGNVTMVEEKAVSSLTEKEWTWEMSKTLKELVWDAIGQYMFTTPSPPMSSEEAEKRRLESYRGQ